MTTFTFGATTLNIDHNPLAPRNYEEEQNNAEGYDSTGKAYAYDLQGPVYRTESLIFPALEWNDVERLFLFLINTARGSLNTFTWTDRLNVTRSANYKSFEYIQLSYKYFKVTLTLEVLT